MRASNSNIRISLLFMCLIVTAMTLNPHLPASARHSSAGRGWRPFFPDLSDSIGGGDGRTGAMGERDAGGEGGPPCSTRSGWEGRRVGRRAFAGFFGAAVLLPGSARGEGGPLCDDGISVLTRGNRRVVLLGTAHISTISAKLARDVVRSEMPDTVFVELDAKRIKSRPVTPPTAGSQLGEVGGEGGGVDAYSSSPGEGSGDSTKRDGMKLNFNPLGYFKKKVNSAAGSILGKAISSMYKKLDSAGFSSGEEFTAAMTEASNIGARIVLGDRDVDVTLNRLAEAIGKTDFGSVDFDMMDNIAADTTNIDINDFDTGDKIDKEVITDAIESMKKRNNVSKLMGSLKEQVPLVYAAMVAERDIYMANGIDELQGESKSLVSITGIAHLDGIEAELLNRGWKKVGMCAGKGAAMLGAA